ncbi:hypothetical protein C6503_22070 [Candidatus Poribacteria bacterium]|nr:MAG: hypothetical protein C6503_22070 [Candidatus Poribacteria bacterium]
MIKNFILIVIITSAALFVCSDTGAEQIQTYTVADGLVGPVVPVIFQDSRGVLWFGSDRGGVSRFYDNTFKPYAGSPEGSEDVEAGALLGQTQQIVEDKWGRIWFISRDPSEKSGKISRFDGSSVRFISTGNALIVDQHGDIWVGENQVLTKYVAQGIEKLPQAQPHEIIGEDLVRSTSLTISAIFQSKDGTLWLGGSEGEAEKTGVILTFRENPWNRPELGGEGDTDDAIDDGTPRIHPNAGFTRPDMSTLNAYTSIETIAEDASGDLWFGGDNLLLRFDGKDFKQILPTGSIFPPGTRRPGSIFPPGSRRRSSSRGIPIGRPASIQIDTKDRVWFSDGRPTRQWNGSLLQRHRDLRGFLEFEDKLGNLWFTEGHGIHQYDTDLKRIPSTVNSALGSDEIRTVFEAVDGKLWFGHNNGVTVFDPTPAVSTQAGLGTKRIQTMFEDSRGFLWLSVPGGVARYDTKTDESSTDPLRLDPTPNMPTLEPQGIRSGSGRPQSEIVKIFEVGGDIWFINEPESHFRSTRYTFFRYANASFDHQISIFIRTKTGPGGERSDSNTDVLVTEGEHVWLAFGGHLFKADATGLLWLTERGTERILFQKTAEMRQGRSVQEIEPGAVAITDLYRDAKGRLWVHFGNGNVKRYPKTIDRAASTTRLIESDVLNLKATTLLKTTPVGKWFFNAVTGRLIRWNNIETGEPVVLEGESTAAPLAVWQNPTEQNEDIIFIFSSALKTYRGTVLNQTQVIDELGTVNASLTSQDGVLWLATSRGAVRYDGENLTTYTTKEDGFLVDNVRDVIEDSRGNIWFATRGGGTVRYDGEIFHNRTTKNGWAHNNISKILESSDKDIWFATERGVTQYTPTRGGLPECRIITLEADKPYTDFSSNLVLSARGAKIFNVRGISPLREGLSYEFKLIGLDTPEWTKLSTEEFTLLPTNSGLSFDQWTPLSAPGLANQQAIDNRNVTQEFQNQNGILRIRYTGLKAGNYSFLIKAFREDWAYTALPAVVDFSIPPPIWTRWRTYLPTLIFVTVVLSLIGRLIVNRRHTLQLRNAMRQQEEAEMQRIRAELSEAQNIQMGLLPTESPDTKGFDIAGMSVPATQVGGDFYDYLTVADGHTAIAVADAAGKGLRGAMTAVLTNGMLYEVSRFESEAAVILSDLNTGLAPRMYGPSFIAINLAVLNEAEKRVDYANGGQPYPILKQGTDIIEIESGDLPLGSMKRVEYESTAFDLNEGDFLILHTDGLIEALNMEGEMYGTERLMESVSRISDSFTAEETVQHLVDDAHAFVREAEQYDDLTIVVIKRCSTV